MGECYLVICHAAVADGGQYILRCMIPCVASATTFSTSYRVRSHRLARHMNSVSSADLSRIAL